MRVGGLLQWVCFVGMCRSNRNLSGGIVSVQGQSCVPVNATTVCGETPTAWDSTRLECADGGFISALDVWHYQTVRYIQITCSDGGISPAPDQNTSVLDRDVAAFDIGVTSVEGKSLAAYTGVTILGEMHVEGYDLLPSGGRTAVIAGPYAVGEQYSLEATSTDCAEDSYATGLTFWNAGYAILAIQLVCAPVTAACAPPGLTSEFDDGADTSREANADDDEGDDDGALSTKMASIIGGSVAAVVFLGAIIGAVVYVRYRRAGETKSGLENVATAGGASQSDAAHGAVGPIPPAYETLSSARPKSENL